MARSKAKKKKGLARLTASLAGIGALAIGPARSMVLGVLAIGILVGMATLTWQSVSERVLSSGDYIVAADDLEITPLPPWIRTKVANQVFEILTASGGQMSIMDDNVTERVAQAFSLHPWVESVVRVSKHHPALINVELEYRKPVCMVMVRGSGSDKNGLYPVDVHGILLPGIDDFTQVEASQYPCLDPVEQLTAPTVALGEHWGDERVVGAAEIAGAFGPDWQKLQLKRIAPETAQRSAYPGVFSYVLFTRGGTKIIWGRPPGSELPSEARAADKIAWLKEFVEVRGSLDGSEHRMLLDVRNRKGLEERERLAKKKPPQAAGLTR